MSENAGLGQKTLLLDGHVLTRQRYRRIDQGNVAVALRKIAQQSFALKVDILAQQAQVIRVLQYVFEEPLGLLRFADFIEAFYQPEGTHRKG
jgi:hypothetical protein